MHEVLVNRLGGLSLPRKSVVRLTDRPDMTLDVYRGHKTTMQQQQPRGHHTTCPNLVDNCLGSVPFKLFRSGVSRKLTLFTLIRITCIYIHDDSYSHAHNHIDI